MLALALSPVIATPVLAQENGDRPTVSRKKPPAASSTINLVNLLVEQGIIKKEQAEALIRQAENEAYVAREAARDASVKADEAAKAATAAAAAPPGSKRVTYVPEIVKRQLREDLRKDVMAQAKKEGWASPGTYPEWASRIRLYGDIRGRWESIWHPEAGFNSVGQIVDFNAINTGEPYDVSAISNPVFFPTYNTTEDRNRARLRARLGLTADLYDGFSTGLRIGTGSDNSPISTNQTLGGSGGNFSKYQLWLDRAFIKFEPFKSRGFTGYATQNAIAPDTLALTFGRFDNPFWSPTELVWDADLGFDGFALQGAAQVAPGLTPFAAGGAFPIFNTSLDFATAEPVKFASEDKYLFGGQVGFNWVMSPQVDITFAAAIFDFRNVQGRLSSPCNLSDPAVTACDTDDLRPSFAQKGNTYMPLRDIIPTVENGFGTLDQFQYFGLASQFRPAVFSGRVEFNHFAPIAITIDGEYVWNTAFDRSAVAAVAVNNLAATTDGSVGPYDGGNTGWLARLTVGNRKLTNFGDWNAHVGYKYLESDAILDAFADSDFGLGGTNLCGYFLGANFALSNNVWASARWMSANNIAGAPYAVDIFQVDLNAKF